MRRARNGAGTWGTKLVTGEEDLMLAEVEDHIDVNKERVPKDPGVGPEFAHPDSFRSTTNVLNDMLNDWHQ